MITRNLTLSWLLFLVLGAGMWFLRYGNILSSHHLDLLIAYGPYTVLVIHVVLVLMAFQDSVFQGILCLLIPLYSFYWLFIIVDAFYVRAIVAGILVGVGLDSAAFYQEIMNDTIRLVRNWIASGG